MTFLERIKIIARNLKSRKYGYFGDYDNWRVAQQYCAGYEAENILEKIKASTLEVKNGKAVFERDSVIFDKIQYSWPLLSALMWVAALNKGRINVVDFGGSLGSTYFQNKQYLDTLASVKWNIIEQASFIEYGQKSIQDDRLQFFYTIEQAINANGLPDILVIACTLPYLEEPYKLLNGLMRYNIPFLIVDNTPFNYASRDRLTVQKVHPSIYEASYPCWLLNYDKVVQTLESRYSIISEHENDSNIFVGGRKIVYKGFLAKIKSSAA